MLVTCFGYTGYRNAKFGQIQVHERITETSRELLLQIKGAGRGHGLPGPARHYGLPMGHRRAYIGVQGGRRGETGILTEVDSYNWITFLPMSDGTAAHIRYNKQKVPS